MTDKTKGTFALQDFTFGEDAAVKGEDLANRGEDKAKVPAQQLADFRLAGLVGENPAAPAAKSAAKS